jgi:hypothetical protein
MRPCLRILLLAACLALVAAAPASAAVHLTQVGTFDTPVYVTAPPGDPHRLFVVEKAGRIVVVRDGQTLEPPLLDISSEIVSTGERGLLSVAFAPDYATSHKLYAYYTAPLTGDPGGSVITVQELATQAGDPDALQAGSRRTLFTVDHPGQSNHDGGQLQVGPDGLLYAATGDGGGGNDQGAGRPPNNAQNLGSMLGKILRIDPRAAGSTPEIYASGLRNPWRFSFDRATGDMVIGDVGQSAREEVDVAPAGTPPGTNYGWVCWEGTRANTDAGPPCDPSDDVFPVLEKDHSADGFCAIVGGYVVRDPALTGLAGRYVYGDNCSSALRSAALVPPPDTVSDDSDSGLSVAGLTSFGEDSCGHLYATSGSGPVYRVDGDSFTPCPEAQAPGPGGGGGGGGGGPGGGAGRVDKRAPVVQIGAQRRQLVLRRRGVRLGLGCSETCGVSVRGTIRIARSGKRSRTRLATRQVAPKQRVKLKLRLTRAQRRAIAAAMRRHRRVTIRLSAAGRDAAGNRGSAAKTIRARR